jgi:hypothetical protein
MNDHVAQLLRGEVPFDVGQLLVKAFGRLEETGSNDGEGEGEWGSDFSKMESWTMLGRRAGENQPNLGESRERRKTHNERENGQKRSVGLSGKSGEAW